MDLTREEAISEMNNAPPMLIGIAMIMAPKVTRRVPTVNEKVPNWSDSVGLHMVPERKLQISVGRG